jgi:lysophospholipase L1-like esterase
MGDSISAGAGSNWIGQLSAYPATLTFSPSLNKAVGGATSSTVVSGQLNSVKTLALNNQIDGSVLMIGGNDATGAAGTIMSGGSPTSFINTYFNNVKTVIDTIASASGSVKQVFGNMPDVTKTPLVISQAAASGYGPSDLALLSSAISQANALADAYALAHGVPVIDMYGVTNSPLIETVPFVLGGYSFTTPFASDQFHPAVWTQGLLGNLVDTAFNLRWGTSLPILSDQKIVQNAGKTPNNATTYIDLSPFVLLPVPEPASWLLVVAGALCLGIWRRARRAT